MRDARGRAKRLPDLAGGEILEGLAAPDEPRLAALQQDFGSAGPEVVVRSHGEAVGTRVENGEKVSFEGLANGAVLGEEIAALAHRAHDVRGDDARSGGAGDVLAVV